MKKLYLSSKLILLAFLFLSTSLIANAQYWIAKSSGITTNLRSVWFVSATQGWAVGAAGVILTTSDGGDTWTPQSSGVSVNLMDVFFVSPTTGWAVGSNQILYTNNGGVTWTITSLSQGGLNSVFFTSPTTGFAAGILSNTGILYKTTNAGATWQLSSATFAKGINRIFFSSPTNGWVACSRGMVYATTDGGNTWVQQLAAGSTVLYELFGLFMFNNNKGWVCGNNAIKIKHTNDGGATWTNQNPNTVAGLSDITFTDSLNGWIVGSTSLAGGNPIRYTTNGGATWIQDTLFVPVSGLRGVHFYNSSLGWAVGDGGYIVKYEAPVSVTQIKPENNFLIYPNPATNRFQVQGLKFKQGDALKVFDIMGKQILSVYLNWEETEIDVSKFEKGIYFVHLISSDENQKRIITKKLIIN